MESEDSNLVKSWMRSKISVPSEATIVEVAEVMTSEDVGSVLVTVNSVEEGILTERDLTRKVLAKGLDPKTTKAKEVMSTPLVTIPQDATLWEAAEAMSRKRVRRLPVVDEQGRVRGMISTRIISYALPLMKTAKSRILQLIRTDKDE
ncbi:CBS domain-containing protein [Candidatus Bathyarchaeota archaeon]|nr:CBS domain-containing protein [Candidatus Bathyarchaeota archaeon]